MFRITSLADDMAMCMIPAREGITTSGPARFGRNLPLSSSPPLAFLAWVTTHTVTSSAFLGTTDRRRRLMPLPLRRPVLPTMWDRTQASERQRHEPCVDARRYPTGCRWRKRGRGLRPGYRAVTRMGQLRGDDELVFVWSFKRKCRKLHHPGRAVDGGTNVDAKATASRLVAIRQRVNCRVVFSAGLSKLT